MSVRKRFGQHFLEPAWVEKVIRAIDPKPDETFIEVGPGRVLTGLIKRIAPDSDALPLDDPTATDRLAMPFATAAPA